MFEGGSQAMESCILGECDVKDEFEGEGRCQRQREAEKPRVYA